MCHIMIVNANIICVGYHKKELGLFRPFGTMNGIYPLDNEKNLILYPSKNTLYLRTTSGESFTRPVILCTDYGKSLTDTIHNSTIYYAYQNTAGDIVVRSITDLQELYHISNLESPDCLNPLLISLQGTLLLFYIIKNPIGNNYYIKALFPLYPEKHITVTDKSFSACPVILAFPAGKGILIHAFVENTPHLFYMDHSFCCREIDIFSDNSDKTVKAQADSEKSALLEKTAQLQKELQERDAIIESIKQQYENLMETASRYKAEAEKWHEIACKQDVRPLPGERLLLDEW